MKNKTKSLEATKYLLSRLWELRLIALLAVSLLAILLFTASFTRSSLPPAQVKVANISDQSLSIAWTTSQPTSAGLLLSTQTNRFARTWEFFVCQNFGLKCHIIYDEISSPSMTHFIFLRNLAPDTAYYYRLASGKEFWKYDSEGLLLPPIKTASTLESLPMPQPVYSYVYETDGKTPVKGALVYFYLFEGTNRQKIKSQPLMTYTDSRGVWLLDLGNLRSQDTKSWVKPNLGDLAMILIETADGKHTGGFVEMKQSVNLEPIILK